MELIDQTNAAEYLRRTGRIGDGEQVAVRELAGGVSNVVLYVRRPYGVGDFSVGDFVVKQARERLRVSQPWFCPVERIWREIDVLRVCQNISADPKAPESIAVRTPSVLFEDRDNHLFGMTAAQEHHITWKAELLSGVAEPKTAAAMGCWLASLHGGTWRDERLAALLGDMRWFDALRLDPYFRAVANVYPDLRPQMERLIAVATHDPRCVVHADFSPKNVLVYPDSNADRALMLVDFETGHFGNPAFDLGFFLTHLVLKAFYHAPQSAPFVALIRSFLAAYEAELKNRVPAIEADTVLDQAVPQLAGCLLARLDGKSPVEYLTHDDRRDHVRQLAFVLFQAEPNDWVVMLQNSLAKF